MKLARSFSSVFLLCSTSVVPILRGAQDIEHTPFQIAVVNYFGYGDLDLPAIRKAVPLHAGAPLTYATFSKEPTAVAVRELTGHAPTDINVTCCDNDRRLLVYIGLPGSTSRPVGGSRIFTSDVVLPAPATQLYGENVAALEKAVASGDASEDDSQGYALSNNPPLHAIDLRMRSFALTHTPEILQVLRNAKDANQRRVAATLAGYAQRSPTQIQALTAAVQDPDDEVRNNAVRALEVLASARPFPADPRPFIALLYSGVWTDRNKASFFLMHLTDTPDPQLLTTLRQQALPALIEGGSWKSDPGHSTPFLVILGRIGHIPDADLGRLIAADNVGTIAAAAQQGEYHAATDVN